MWEHQSNPRSHWLIPRSSTVYLCVYAADACANVMQLNKRISFAPMCQYYVIKQVVTAVTL